MQKIKQTINYLVSEFGGMAAIALCCILLCVAATNLVYHLTLSMVPPKETKDTLTIPVEFTAAFFALMTGMALFLVNIRVALANGISRKTYLLANLPAAALMAGGLAVFNEVTIWVHNWFWPAVMVLQVTNPQLGPLGLWFAQFAQFFLFIVVGWLIRMAYYRSGTLMKWAISLAPVILIFALFNADARTNGAVFEFIHDVIILLHGDHNPYQSSLMLLVYAAISTGLVYLLLRRAPLK